MIPFTLFDLFTRLLGAPRYQAPLPFLLTQFFAGVRFCSLFVSRLRAVFFVFASVLCFQLSSFSSGFNELCLQRTLAYFLLILGGLYLSYLLWGCIWGRVRFLRY
jgi:hypothetical protein